MTESVSRSGRPIARNRAHVLETAMNAYWRSERGCVSVNSVCVLAGISKPSLYREFGSEDGLTAAVLELYGETVLMALEELLSGPLSYRAKLDALISFASDDNQMEAGCLFVKMRATRSSLGPQTQALLAKMEARFHANYDRLFHDAVCSGERLGGIKTELYASFLLEQLGLAVSQRAAGKKPETVRGLLTLAFSGLR